MNRILVALVLALPLFAGCASSQPKPQSGLATRDENGNKVNCRMERPLGSNIAEMVCRTEESRSQDSQAAQDAMRGKMKSGTSPASN